MGGIADYSGSLVLQRPIAEATFAAVQRIDRPALEIVSLGRPPCTIPLDALAPGGAPVGYDRARADVRRRWCEASHRAGSGVRRRRLPRARARARDAADVGRENRRRLDGARGQGRELLGRHRNREHARGRGRLRHRARAARSRAPVPDERESRRRCAVRRDGPDDVRLRRARTRCWRCSVSRPNCRRPCPIPDDVEFWGLDSGERHAVGGSDYGAVRTGAFMGLRIVAEHAGAPVDYLANIALADFERELGAPSAGARCRATNSWRDTAARRTR